MLGGFAIVKRGLVSADVIRRIAQAFAAVMGNPIAEPVPVCAAIRAWHQRMAALCQPLIDDI